MNRVIFLLFFILAIILSAVADDKYMNMEKAPSLDVDGAYIIDIKPFREKIKDNIAFYNLIKNERNSFDIYYVDYNTGKWEKNNKTGFIDEYEESETVSLNKGITLKKIPFIAIVPQHSKVYSYNIYPKNRDVYIEVKEKTFDDIIDISLFDNVIPAKDNAIIIDIDSLSKKPEENIKIINQTRFSNYTFAIYGYKLNNWLPINIYQRKDFIKVPDSCSISFDFVDYKIRYIAVGVSNGIITKYSTAVKHSDLYIYIEDIDDKSPLKDSCEMSIDFNFKDKVCTETRRVIEATGYNKDEIFDAIMSACVDFFKKSDYVIEYSNKEVGKIKGKYKDPDFNHIDIVDGKIEKLKNDSYITFTFEIKDNKYRVILFHPDFYVTLHQGDDNNKLNLIFKSYPIGISYQEILIKTYPDRQLDIMTNLIAQNMKDAIW